MNTKNTNTADSSIASTPRTPGLDEHFKNEGFFQACVLEIFRDRDDVYIMDTSLLHRFQQGFAGQPDLTICKSGRFCALELKGKYGKATSAQERQLERVREAGGVAAVCYTLQDVFDAIDQCAPVQ